MQKVLVTKMKPEDLDEVYEIDKSSFSIPWSKESFENELKNILATYFVARLDNKIIGYIGSWLIIDECHITNIAVDLSYRRKGIAYELVKTLLNYCNENGISYAYLEVRKSNMPAQKLYERFGFKSDGIRKDYYKNPDGTFEDAILMSKEI